LRRFRSRFRAGRGRADVHADPEYRAAVQERFDKILAAFDKAANAQR
jgi:hypothetical protein